MTVLNLKLAVALGLGATVALSGCTRLGGGGLNQGGTLPTQQTTPTNLTPAPTARVEETKLEPVQPTTPAVETPTVETPKVEEPKIAKIDPPKNTTPMTSNSLLGNWDINLGGSNCVLFLSLTPRDSNANRGGTLRCPDAVRKKIKGWKLKGSQLVLYDDSLNTVASLYKSREGRLDGSTSTGAAISLSRPS